MTSGGPVVLKEQRTLKVALVVDQPGFADVGTIPDEVERAIFGALKTRNMQADRFSDAKLANKRSSAQRISLLSTGDDALLVEVQASYYSQLNGLFRWVVNGRVSFRPAGQSEVAEHEFERPVFMRFAHEDASDAIDAARRSIVDAVTYVIDGHFREAQPRASADATYLAMVDRFKNGDPTNDGEVDLGDPQAFHGGDLAGVRTDLERLSAMGFNALWLTPLYKTRPVKFKQWGAFHGYWVRDFTTLEPRFGRDEELDALVRELNARGMSLMLDVVLNHADYDAPIVTRRPTLFHDDVSIINWDDPVERVVREVHGLPDFAQERPEARDYLIEVHRRWVERTRPARIRIDAARHMPNAFIRDFGAAMREVHPELEVVGEYWEGNAAKLASNARDAGFDAVFDFPLYYGIKDALCTGAGTANFLEQLSSTEVYPRGAQGLLTFVDNHDLPRVATLCGERAPHALVALMSARGRPVITWGTESRALGEEEPHNRADLAPVDADMDALLRALLALRAAHPALVDALTVVDASDAGVIRVDRVLERGALRVLFNLSDKEVSGHGAPLIDVGGCQPRVAVGAACVFRVSEALPHREGNVAVAFDLEPGVVVVGASPALGAWRPERAPINDDGQVEVQLRAPGAYAYKLAKREGAGWHFEDGSNRLLVVDGRSAARAEPRWRN